MNKYNDAPKGGIIMQIVRDGVLLGLFWFGILLVMMYIIKRYMDVADIIGGKIIGFLQCLRLKLFRK